MTNTKQAVADATTKAITGKLVGLGIGALALALGLIVLVTQWDNVRTLVNSIDQLSENSEAIAALQATVADIDSVKRDLEDSKEDVLELKGKLAEASALNRTQDALLADHVRELEDILSFVAIVESNAEEEASQRFAITAALNQFENFEERFEADETKILSIESDVIKLKDDVSDLRDDLTRTDGRVSENTLWRNDQRERALGRIAAQAERDNQLAQTQEWSSRMADAIQEIQHVLLKEGNELSTLKFPPYENKF